MRPLFYTTLLLFSLFFSACQLFEQEAEVPSYIYIKHIDLATDYPSQGSASHEITDAWIYMDDNPVGVFPLPCRVPILAEGAHKITVYAGVKADGIASRRRMYPYYKPFIISSFELRRGKVDTLNGANQPVVEYYPTTSINIWKGGDFEDPGVVFGDDPASDTTMERTLVPQEVFEGNGSGIITLSATQSHFKATTAEDFRFPTDGRPVYMELNYRTNNTLKVGLTATNPGGTVHLDNTNIRPSFDESGNPVWKKIYVDLSELVNYSFSATSFEVYFRMTKDEGVTVPIAYIDNVKLVYGK